MQNKIIIIGTRGSRLALKQAESIRDLLCKDSALCCPLIEIKIIKTSGDKFLNISLDKIGGKGLFTKEIEDALLKKEIDLAVHSMKDLPVELPEGLSVAAITKREDARDILVSKFRLNLRDLKSGSRVGTSSLRRRAQVLNFRSDLEVVNLRGNVETRIKKLEAGLYDAIVIAFAGARRLFAVDKHGFITDAHRYFSYLIPVNRILPQAGQGALGIQVRKGDSEIANLVKKLNDQDSRLAVEAERALLGRLGGGCHAPIGAYAKIEKNNLCLAGGVFSLDGKIAIKDEISGGKNKARSLGVKLADRLLKKGAEEILKIRRD